MAPRLWDTPICNQHQASMPDGAIDWDWAKDCGEEVVRMILAKQAGVWIGGGTLREELGTVEGTSNDELVALLRNHGVAARAGSPGAQHILGVLERQYRLARLTAVLGFFAGPYELHWVLCVDGRPDSYWFNDPWWGWRTHYGGAAVLNMYRGQTVECLTPIRF